MLKEKLLFLMLSSLMFMGNLNAQMETINIIIETDAHPEETSWLLLNQNGDTLATDNGKMIEANAFYDWKIEVEEGICVYFEINDSGNNGFGTEAVRGFYLVSRSSLPHNFYGTSYTDQAYHYLGDCGFGRTCETAEVITGTNIYSPPIENYWYQYTPTADGIFSITNCNNAILIDTGRVVEFKNLDTRLWIYNNCPSRLFEGPEGALTYSDEYYSCFPSAGFDFVAMKAGITYYIRLAYDDTISIDWVNLSFYELPELEGCTDPVSCNYNPYATKDDGSCFYSDDCLPDLTIGDSLFRNTLALDKIEVLDECLIEEQCVQGYGERDVIRFSTEIRNIGTADFIVGNPESSTAGAFSKENCHEHWHQLGYAEYLLFRGNGEPEPVGFKSGFCVLDIDCSDNITPKYTCDFMGITAGCYDVYTADIDCQWIDVTDVPDGDYTMVARVNWTKLPDLRGKREITYDNNTVQVCFNLDRSSDSLVMTILEDCSTYKDCFGINNGSAIVDCEGNCGGNAEFGDVNRDTRVNQDDINFYLDGIKTDDITPTFCTDLSGDGRISTYDVALLQQCSESNSLLEDGHTHCNFPKTILNEQQKAIFQITELNTTAGYFDVAYKSPDVGLKGFQLKIGGVTKLNRVENLTQTNLPLHYTNDQQIFTLLPIGHLPTTFEYTKLFRVYFEEMVENTVELQAITEVISQDYQLILSEVTTEILDTLPTETTACEQLKVYAWQQSIQIEGIDLINTRIRYVGPATNWQDSLVCDGNCQESQRINALPLGNYTVKVETFNPYCYATFEVEIESENICGQMTINGGVTQIELANIPKTAKVEWIGQATNWENQLVCDGDCPENEKIPVSQPGKYLVKVQTFSPYCYSQKEVIVSPDTEANSTETSTSCETIRTNITNDTLTISELMAPNNIIKVYDGDWQLIFECTNCSDNVFIPINRNTTEYHIDLQSFDANWEALCARLFTLNQSNGLTARNAPQLRLHAFLKAQKVQLEWLSNSSWRTNYFELQRSVDKQNFVTIGQIKTKGEHDALHYYRQEDTQLVYDTTYYRIKEIYKDGTSHYANTQIVTSAYASNTITISPNPASDFLQLNLSPFLGKSVGIQLVNHLGKIIQVQSITALTAPIASMEVREVPSGFYFVQIVSEGRRMISQKVIIERS